MIVAIDLNKINKLQQKQKIILVVGIVVLMLGLYWYLFFQSKQQELAAGNQKLVQLQNQLAEDRTLAADLPRFQEELKRLKAELGEALRQLPNNKELPVLLTDITTLGKNAGLEFKSFIPQREVKKDFYAVVPINIELVGGFHELATFFDQLSRLDRIVSIKNFAISHVEIKNDQVSLDINGQALTYRFMTPEEAKAVAAAASKTAKKK
jgi:type IV pilus assembly protein PilO